jgi:hypothetical protein
MISGVSDRVQGGCSRGMKPREEEERGRKIKKSPLLGMKIAGIMSYNKF